MNALPPLAYEKQSDPQSSRMCGAACLSMVYRSLGKPADQASIWPAIAKVNQFGSIASTTHLMAADALGKGFSAVAIQARHPLQVLRRCADAGIHAILNHRLSLDTPTGHYTVLVDIDDKEVVLHDPFLGPSRRLSHAELIEIWRPGFPNSEIAGNVLIGIGPEPHAPLACEFCHVEIPVQVTCPQCAKPVSLQPSALLGCIRDGCIARMWNYVCCPSCDFFWSFNQAAPQAAAAAPAPQSVPDPQALVTPVDFEKVFAAMDNFCSHVMSIPGASARTDLRTQVDYLLGLKEKIKLAQIEGLSHARARQELITSIGQEAAQKEAAHRRKVEELNQPAPALDGDALGHALLKNLGFIR